MFITHKENMAVCFCFAHVYYVFKISNLSTSLKYRYCSTCAFKPVKLFLPNMPCKELDVQYDDTLYKRNVNDDYNGFSTC